MSFQLKVRFKNNKKCPQIHISSSYWTSWSVTSSFLPGSALNSSPPTLKHFSSNTYQVKLTGTACTTHSIITSISLRS